jgi:hypothetical protein
MDGMTPIEAAGVWSGLLILLLAALAFRVVSNRRKHRVLFGDGGVDAMLVATRAFGNAAEYLPVGVAALLLLALTGFETLAVHLFGALFLAGRVIHAVGLRVGKGPGAGRLVGMVLTLLPLMAVGVLLVVRPLLG